MSIKGYMSRNPNIVITQQTIEIETATKVKIFASEFLLKPNQIILICSQSVSIVLGNFACIHESASCFITSNIK